MRRWSRLSVQHRRAGSASLVVVGLAAALAGGCFVGEQAGAGEAQGALAGKVWEALRQGGDMPAALRAVGLDQVAADEVPTWFAQEVLSPQEDWELRAADGWCVVGISCTAAEDALRAYVEEQLAALGWVRCPTGVEGEDAYIKEGGTCTWMMVGMSATAGSADVVLRILRD